MSHPPAAGPDKMSFSEITSRLSGLYSAVLCDVLDTFDLRHQALSHQIRPLFSEARVIGRARTLLSRPVDRFPEKPYAMELEALDTLVEYDVVVFTTDADLSAAVWGELLSIAALAKGARGAIIDGLTRDAAKIREARFPVFARGISSYDSHGRSEVIAYDVPIQCDGVAVQPGDIVFGDYDGVVVIPASKVEIVIEKAEVKVRREGIVGEEFKRGRKVADVFAEHGIL
ncbi:MAG TPA: RraA family protein [Bryobacteraceae bacterium]|jgi:regulator of RNase E activity RraA|nr:RraA family protein [Bryobacteraceae bacterium]